jgi:hypothetical protein
MGAQNVRFGFPEFLPQTALLEKGRDCTYGQTQTG